MVTAATITLWRMQPTVNIVITSGRRKSGGLTDAASMLKATTSLHLDATTDGLHDLFLPVSSSICLINQHNHLQRHGIMTVRLDLVVVL